MAKCNFDTRWISQNGIGRFAEEIHLRITSSSIPCKGRPMSPVDPFRLSFLKLRRDEWFFSPGYNAPIISRSPYIITIHDINHIDRPENSNLFKKIYYKIILKSLCKKSRAILTVSEFSKQRIIDWFGVNPTHVFNVGNGVSEAFHPQGRRYEAAGEYILCVSNRRGHKNEKGLLQAFAKTRLLNTAKLLITGEINDELEEFIQEHNLLDRVIFTGKVSEDDLAALYRGALFLVFPSFYEGFGLPIIEAFASGTPVITSNVTSMPEIAGDAALLVDPNNVGEIAAAIDKLYGSSELRAELVQRGFKRVENFTWDAVADRVKAAVKAVDTDPSHPLSWN